MIGNRPEANWYRDEARRRYHRPRGENTAVVTIEIDPDAPVSQATAPGGWVMAWVWIPAPGGDHGTERTGTGDSAGGPA